MVVKDIEREDIEFISKILGVEAGNPAWISIQDPVGDVSGKKLVPPTYPSWFITVCCLVFIVM